MSIVRAVRVGAVGYLLKDATAPEFLQPIKSTAMGQVHLFVNGDQAARGRDCRTAAWICSQSARPTSSVCWRTGPPISRLVGTWGLRRRRSRAMSAASLSNLGVQSRALPALRAGRVGLVPLSELGDTDLGD
jgi:hypothetical protein